MLVDAPILFGYEIFEAWEYYYIVLVLLIMSIALVLNILRSPLGRSMLAVRDSEISAESLGIRVARTKVLAFLISASLTGLPVVCLPISFSFCRPKPSALFCRFSC